MPSHTSDPTANKRKIPCQTEGGIPNASWKVAVRFAKTAGSRSERGAHHEPRTPRFERCFRRMFSSLSSVISIRSDLTLLRMFSMNLLSVAEVYFAVLSGEASLPDILLLLFLREHAQGAKGMSRNGTAVGARDKCDRDIGATDPESPTHFILKVQSGVLVNDREVALPTTGTRLGSVALLK